MQYSVHSPIPDLYQWSLWLFGKSLLSISWWLHPVLWHPSYIKQAGLKKVTSWSNTWKITFNPDKCHTPSISLLMDHLANPPILFLKILLTKFTHSNYWVSQSMIFLRQTTCGSWRLAAGGVEESWLLKLRTCGVVGDDLSSVFREHI